jgi:hypothetical protein
MPPQPRPLSERLMSGIEFDTNGGCWLWTKRLNPRGYGEIGVGSAVDGSNRVAFAHRTSYEAFVGSIPSGLELDHLCRVRCCINPAHLEPVTHAENLARGFAVYKVHRAKTHCPRGHPYDADNTRLYQGRRFCKACGVRADRASRDAFKAAGLTSRGKPRTGRYRIVALG